MTNLLHKAAVVVLVAGVVLVYALINFFPVVPHSISGWAALAFVGVPLLFLLEAVGGRLFELEFWERWPSPVRILCGVVAFLGIAALLYLPLKFVVRLIGS